MVKNTAMMAAAFSLAFSVKGSEGYRTPGLAPQVLSKLRGAQKQGTGLKSLFQNKGDDCKFYDPSDPNTKKSILYGQNSCLSNFQGVKCNNEVSDYLFATSNSNSVGITNTVDTCQSASTHDTCRFDVGDEDVTKISFDYEIHPSCDGTWGSFWMYTVNTQGSRITTPGQGFGWDGAAEVDFVEGPTGGKGGWATNFDGISVQGPLPDWSGSIEATFSGDKNKYSEDCVGIGGQSWCPGGNCTPFACSDVEVSVLRRGKNGISNTVHRKGTLQSAKDYFFVIDTALGGSADCKLTITNLQLEGNHPGCPGIP